MIDSQLLDAYVAELEALRRHGSEFAQMFPDIAGRLDIGPRRSRDPHVDRVVESAAFLAARLRLMIESSATELPLATLSMLAPGFVEPIPSMALLDLRGGAEPQTVARGTQFEHQIGGQALAGFTTTMTVTAAPFSLRLRRLQPSAVYPDGIGVQFSGQPPQHIIMCLGNNELTAAVLMDAFAENLTEIQITRAEGDPIRVPITRLQVHGFTPDEAALPIRPAVHNAHRVVTEFMVFPEKFRFVSLDRLPLRSNSEIRFWFSRPLQLPPMLPADLITINRVPGINLWQSSATPFDVDGRKLEYPVRVDALRHRTVECHSVEHVDLYGLDPERPVRLDPVIALGEVRGTAVRWSVKRSVSRLGGEVLLYFQGLDYRTLGRERLLAAPGVLANNRDIAQHLRVGARLDPVEGLGGWHCFLASTPSVYRPALTGSRAMETLIGYLRSSLSSLATERRRGLLGDYLQRFPGAQEASWLNGIGAVVLRPVAEVHRGHPQPGLAVVVGFDGEQYRTTSRAMIGRVLGMLFESQRGINRVQKVVVQSS